MDLISLWRGRKMHLMHLRFNTPALELFRYVCYYESGSDSESWPMSLEEVKPAQESLQLIWWGGRLGCHGTIGRTTTYRLRFNVFHNCSFASKRPQMYYFVICINKCGFSRRVCPLVWQSMGGSMGMFPGWGIDPTESAAGTGVLVSAPIHPTQEMHCCCYFCILQIAFWAAFQEEKIGIYRFPDCLRRKKLLQGARTLKVPHCSNFQLMTQVSCKF